MLSTKSFILKEMSLKMVIGFGHEYECMLLNEN